ncbi:MAG: F0F1 ATP synthase subunit delta [Actinomycetes bacterium]|jgi:F-type H+-transporting ATPase subunit delta
MLNLGGNSRQSLSAIRVVLDEKLKGLSPSECTKISSDLFEVLAILQSSGALRRAVTDPARDHEAKSALVKEIFGKSVQARTIELLVEIVALRWSRISDLVEAIEQLAVEAEATTANIDDSLNQVEEELYAFSKVLTANGDLRQALNNSQDSGDRKSELVTVIFGGKYHPSSVRLLTQLVRVLQRRNIELALLDFIDGVSARHNRLRAVVRSRVPLTHAQREKLVETLSSQMGQPVHVSVELDAGVIGGVEVRFDEEVIDGTISNRLAEAGRALAV